MGKSYITYVDYVERREKFKEHTARLLNDTNAHLFEHGVGRCHRTPGVISVSPRTGVLQYDENYDSSRPGSARQPSRLRQRPGTAPAGTKTCYRISRPCREKPIWPNTFVQTDNDSSSSSSSGIRPKTAHGDISMCRDTKRLGEHQNRIRTGLRAPASSPLGSQLLRQTKQKPSALAVPATEVMLAFKMLQTMQRGKKTARRDSVASLAGSSVATPVLGQELERELASFGGHYNRPSSSASQGCPQKAVYVGSAILVARPATGVATAPELRLCAQRSLKKKIAI